MNRRLFIWLAVAGLCILLFLLQFLPAVDLARRNEFSALLLYHSLLPRSAMALVAGAALGLAGFVLQTVLRNPIADSSTLGVAAGAQLALVAATLYFPVLLAGSFQTVAFAGGIIGLGLVLLLNWRRQFEPVGTIITGLIISLMATSLSATLILGRGEYVMSIFIWGGGSLAQDSWQPVLGLAWRLLVCLAAVALLLRPMTVLTLAEDSARNLGVRVGLLRFCGLGLATLLASSVTAYVGIIGFVGLAAPAIARASGARTAKAQFLAAPAIGAALLLLADGLAQAATPAAQEALPTGAVTALLGGPVLLWLLPRLRNSMSRLDMPYHNHRLKNPKLAMLVLLAVLVLCIVLSLCLGRGVDGWQLATGNSFQELLVWRAPRIAIAIAAGSMLAAAGTILQRLTGNPMASPEVLGISSGAGLGLALLLILVPAPGGMLSFVACLAGSLVALAAILLLAMRNPAGPERLLLAGIALGSFSGAAMTAVTAQGGMAALQMLAWLSGSLEGAEPGQAWMSLLAAAVLLAPLMFLGRWLALLPMGKSSAISLGISYNSASNLLVVLAALLAACATLLVGPLSFAGLLGPHLARQLGFVRPLQHVVAAAFLGAIMLVLADWLARTLIFPYQLPLGLFASLIGGPYLIWIMARRRA
ncbi:Fe(3+)-hydroxamate ABC transporter permease FhuB [Aureimonas fodinaquatilis]|uniref:Fe(3+)-hydroxamate ABC transporter permease FhuB n=1 Tax=Aureimonas fodinaquatilis TaxID=2565783 RepID=A0A5B0DVG4_9HYPH|nr:Fe(3+)-hydroxamate ABC transporter permease FhuB [Aureimonas fodinaquatilis]KAA0970338.1 Fe(3+)-hydroxamate ABC transporter permease FhuB [Aureimonas fodinaquatilis]